MRCREFQRFLTAFAVVVLLASMATSCRRAVTPAPAAGSATNPGFNLLLITLDGVQPEWLGCYGNSNAVTPNLNGFAAAGTCFDAARCPAPLSLPSHASLMTGLEPPEHGVRLNGVASVGDGATTLAGTLRSQGYRTAATIGNPALRRMYGLSQGFEFFDDQMPENRELITFRLGPELQPCRPGADVTASALNLLAAAMQSNRESKNRQPWFLWVNYADACPPRHLHQDVFKDQFKDTLGASVAFLDYQVGRLFEFLGGAGLKESTLVVVVGSYGAEPLLPDPAAARVPLLLARKGDGTAGRRIAGSVSTVDLAPTLLELLQVPPPTAWPASRSFANATRGRSWTERPCYWENLLPYSIAGCMPDIRMAAGYKTARQSPPKALRRTPGIDAWQNPTNPLADVAGVAEGLRAWLEVRSELLVGATNAAAAAQLAAVCDRLSKAAPHSAMLAGWSGVAQARCGHFDQAVSDFQRALLLDPGSPDWLYNVGIADIMTQQIPGAIAALEQAWLALPEDEQLRRQLATVLARAGERFLVGNQPESAYECFSRVAVLYPKSASAQVDVGRTLQALKRNSDAATAYQRALKLEPSNGAARRALQALGLSESVQKE